MPIKTITYERAKQWSIQVLEKVGVSREFAELTTNALVHANLRGVDTHGLVRLTAYVNRVLGTKSEPIKIDKETSTTCVVDAGYNLGPCGASLGMNIAIQNAKNQGMGISVVKHSNHFGTAEYYSLMAAKQNMVGISMTNASPRIAPWGSVQALIGNNPWSVALPSDEFPIVLDIANTVVANGKIRTCLREGKVLDDGWAMDKDGNPTIDPAEAVVGLLMPIGAYKGVGIAVMVDLLCGALSQGAFSKEVGRIDDGSKPTNASHLFMAIDINKLVPLKDFKNSLSKYIMDFKNVRLKRDVKEVFMPGELEWRTEQERLKNGIPLSIKTINELNEMADRISVEHIMEIQA